MHVDEREREREHVCNKFDFAYMCVYVCVCKVLEKYLHNYFCYHVPLPLHVVFCKSRRAFKGRCLKITIMIIIIKCGRN